MLLLWLKSIWLHIQSESLFRCVFFVCIRNFKSNIDFVPKAHLFSNSMPWFWSEKETYLDAHFNDGRICRLQIQQTFQIFSNRYKCIDGEFSKTKTLLIFHDDKYMHVFGACSNEIEKVKERKKCKWLMKN